jgi:hypothetical protein
MLLYIRRTGFNKYKTYINYIRLLSNNRKFNNKYLTKIRDLYNFTIWVFKL